MEEIQEYYKVLNVTQYDSFRKVKKSYNKLMLIYHPSRPLGRLHRDYFKEIVLAFDLLSKLNKYSTDFSRTNKEIYNEWIDQDMAFALEKVDQYSQMRFKDFEKEFLPGCFSVIKGIVYLIYLLIAIGAVVYPVSEYKNGQIPGIFLFFLSVGYTIPLLLVIYKTIVDERFFTRRIWERFKMDLYLFKLRKLEKTDSSSIECNKKGTNQFLNKIEK